MGFASQMTFVTIGVVVVTILGLLALFSKFYRKVEQSKVIIRNGIGGQIVSFGGMFVVPIFIVLKSWIFRLNVLKLPEKEKTV